MAAPPHVAGRGLGGRRSCTRPTGSASRRDADEVRQPAMRAQRISFVVAVLASAVLARAAIPPDVERSLKESKYVYVQSERKSGAFGKPAEIWFLYEGGTVYVASPPTTWRAKRIKAGRRKARIAVGKTDGPSFVATGRTLHDPALEERLMAAYARKYAEGWERFADKFRAGFKDGSRVLIAYTPAD